MDNDVVLLQGELERHRTQVAALMAETDHATFFTAMHYLRHFQPTYEELLSGIVDGEKDRGIDAIYFFANSMCVREDASLAGLGRRPKLDLVLMQVKNSNRITEDSIDKMLVSVPMIFDFGRNEQELLKSVSPRVLENSRRFLHAYRELEMPELHVYTAFVSLKANHVHPATEEKGRELEAVLQQTLAGASSQVQFLTARSIWDLAHETTSQLRQLQLAEIPISTNMNGGFVGLVRLKDYEAFITSMDGELDASLFEANVRDYEGDTLVNESIQETLTREGEEVDFWWLNNGVTIVASRVQQANKLLKLEDAQIVNGLQTSTEIYRRLRTSKEALDDRSVLVKVIEAPDPAIRDRIIRATNSQTSFGPSALRATDRVQRQIEEYLGQRGLYYERRRRQYFNQGRPVDRIVSIDLLGQAVLSTLVQSPQAARREPALVFAEDVYPVVFRTDWPLAAYCGAIQMLREADEILRRELRGAETADDFRFHLAMLCAMAATRKVRPEAQDLAMVEYTEIEPTEGAFLLRVIQEEYRKNVRRGDALLLDQLSKSDEVAAAVRDRGRQYLLSTPRPT